MHLARALPVIFVRTCHKLFDVIIKFAQTKQMCLSMQFLFPNLVIADLYECMFRISMILKLLQIFVSKF